MYTLLMLISWALCHYFGEIVDSDITAMFLDSIEGAVKLGEYWSLYIIADKFVPPVICSLDDVDKLSHLTVTITTCPSLEYKNNVNGWNCQTLPGTRLTFCHIGSQQELVGHYKPTQHHIVCHTLSLLNKSRGQYNVAVNGEYTSWAISETLLYSMTAL